jgi:plastocyanin
MTFSVQAVSRADYESWLADAKAGRTPKPSVQPGGQELTLTASNVAYDKKELEATADQPSTLSFTNKDAIPHDVVIQDQDGKELFKSDTLTGPDASSTFNVPALPAGSYTFFCSYHPTQMVGDLTVK